MKNRTLTPTWVLLILGLSIVGKVSRGKAAVATLVPWILWILGKAGMTMDDLVYVTIYCSDLTLYKTFNDVYRTRFKKEFPARAFIGAGDLLFGMRFEIQGIAVKR